MLTSTRLGRERVAKRDDVPSPASLSLSVVWTGSRSTCNNTLSQPQHFSLERLLSKGHHGTQ